ncbi:cation transporter [Leptolyngbya valderiana BDU 20041]|nr:cation diffusion facilitator family transporter [Geitlerinema sp. CS-897]OAB56894.1 cation transporter [Leptolyngbya valderiana BDU 20041]PPT10961.1 Cobalt-zinc-cadmium resistance protein [Geitlerinema sp. FC II]
MVTDYRPQVRRVLVLTLLLNLFVLALKATLGLWTGSLSVIADALHSVTDSASNVLGLVTSRLSSPQPDRDHPYGHQKFEAVGAIGIAAFLGVACLEILKGVVDRLFFGGREVAMASWVLWLMLVVLGVNILVAFYERRVGVKLGSKILIADAHHTMSDIWITITVIAGLIGVWVGYPWIDLVLAIPVAALVFRSGWEVLRENLPWLVDETAIAPEAIHKAVMEVPGVLNCHDIASRGLIGRQVFVEMHLVVEAKDVETAHDITEAVEEQLEKRFSPVRVMIHIEPPDYKSEQISYGEGTIH